MAAYDVLDRQFMEVCRFVLHFQKPNTLACKRCVFNWRDDETDKGINFCLIYQGQSVQSVKCTAIFDIDKIKFRSSFLSGSNFFNPI